jgi:RNA polymerase sigma factor (TIGR02999 family)
VRPPRSDETPRPHSPASADESASAEESASADGAGFADLSTELYGELRRVAAGALGRERRDHTLQPTALVNEAFLRLAGQRAEWQNRAHFVGVAAQAMRRVLVDHARRRAAAKRPDPRARVTLSGLAAAGAADEVDVLDLETALVRLAAMDPRAARVVELRAFAGCSAAEAAEALGVSEATVARDWRMAQSWLRRELSRGGAGAAPDPPARGDGG